MQWRNDYEVLSKPLAAFSAGPEQWPESAKENFSPVPDLLD